MSRRRETLCPTPSKKAYVDEDDAIGGACSALRNIRRTGRTTTVFYAYRCLCRRWHLSGKMRPGNIRITEETQREREAMRHAERVPDRTIGGQS